MNAFAWADPFIYVLNLNVLTVGSAGAEFVSNFLQSSPEGAVHPACDQNDFFLSKLKLYSLLSSI